MCRLIIVVLFLLTQITFAGDIVPITKGESSPYDGFVITKSFEKKLRTVNEKNKLLEAKTLALSDLQVVNDKRIAFHTKSADIAYTELRREKIKGFFGKVLYFTGGILLGSVVGYATMKLYK